jgi:predicted lipoprotein with Yx(FWY)xxD motif
MGGAVANISPLSDRLNDMKINALLALLGALLMLANCSSDPMMPQDLDAASPAGQPYPAGVTLRKEAGLWTYREFPGGRRLYVFDGDQAGVSNCNSGCVAAGPPLLARANAAIVGDWSVVMREDGRR